MANSLCELFEDSVEESDGKNEIIVSQPSSAKSIEKPNGDNSVLITNLPAEVFQHILRYLTFDNIAKLRLVSRYFNDMCSSLLNSEFSRLRMQVQQRFCSLKAQMPRRESSRRKHPLARESDIIETLYMRLTLLNMTFGKHIERKYCCFFAGEIIDEIYKILHYVECTPSLNRAYKVTDELFDLSTMAMEYFKEHIEPSLPEVTYFASDVLEYPSFSSVRTQHAILNEVEAVGTAEGAALSPTCYSFQNLYKRFKLLNKKVNRNSKEIANVKRSAKAMNLKINSLEEVVNQMKWKQKSCDTTTLPLKMNESHKISEILVQLNMCKQEIEHLTTKLSVCSDKESKPEDKDVSGVNIAHCSGSSNNANCSGSSSQNITSTINSDYIMNPKISSLEVKGKTKHGATNSAPSWVSVTSKKGKRKIPSCTVTSQSKYPKRKRNHTVEELDDSGIQDEQISTNS